MLTPAVSFAVQGPVSVHHRGVEFLTIQAKCSIQMLSGVLLEQVAVSASRMQSGAGLL